MLDELGSKLAAQSKLAQTVGDKTAHMKAERKEYQKQKEKCRVLEHFSSWLLHSLTVDNKRVEVRREVEQLEAERQRIADKCSETRAGTGVLLSVYHSQCDV
jgi:hypothetical protein